VPQIQGVQGRSRPAFSGTASPWHRRRWGIIGFPEG